MELSPQLKPCPVGTPAASARLWYTPPVVIDTTFDVAHRTHNPASRRPASLPPVFLVTMAGKNAVQVFGRKVCWTSCARREAQLRCLLRPPGAAHEGAVTVLYHWGRSFLLSLSCMSCRLAHTSRRTRAGLSFLAASIPFVLAPYYFSLAPRPRA